MPQDEEPDKNREMRHAACRQFVFWQFGRLDKGHLSLITKKRKKRGKYQDLFGQYTGFHPSRIL